MLLLIVCVFELLVLNSCQPSDEGIDLDSAGETPNLRRNNDGMLEELLQQMNTDFNTLRSKLQLHEQSMKMINEQQQVITNLTKSLHNAMELHENEHREIRQLLNQRCGCNVSAELTEFSEILNKTTTTTITKFEQQDSQNHHTK
jgi:hypothetical protein